MLTNTTLLEHRIKRQGYTLHEFAKYIGVSDRAAALKIADKSQFKQSEIVKAAQLLEMNESDILEIFFFEG